MFEKLPPRCLNIQGFLTSFRTHAFSHRWHNIRTLLYSGISLPCSFVFKPIIEIRICMLAIHLFSLFVVVRRKKNSRERSYLVSEVNFIYTFCYSLYINDLHLALDGSQINTSFKPILKIKTCYYSTS